MQANLKKTHEHTQTTQKPSPNKKPTTSASLWDICVAEEVIKACGLNVNYIKIVHKAHISMCFISSTGSNFQQVLRPQALQLQSLQTPQMEGPKTDVL